MGGNKFPHTFNTFIDNLALLRLIHWPPHCQYMLSSIKLALECLVSCSSLLGWMSLVLLVHTKLVHRLNHHMSHRKSVTKATKTYRFIVHPLSCFPNVPSIIPLPVAPQVGSVHIVFPFIWSYPNEPLLYGVYPNEPLGWVNNLISHKTSYLGKNNIAIPLFLSSWAKTHANEPN